MAWLRTVREHLLAVACVLAGTLCAFLVRDYAPIADLAMIQLLGVVMAAARFSVRASVVACIAGILAFDFFFIPPRFAFAWTDTKSSLTFIAMLVVAFMISGLNQRLREQEQAARAAALRAEALYQLSAELSGTNDPKLLAAIAARHLEKLFSARVTILLAAADGALEPEPAAREAEIAGRAWMRREFTCRQDVEGCSIWLPLVGAHAAVGLLGMRVAHAFARDSSQGFLLSVCALQFATAIERSQFASAMQRTMMEAETERLRSSLLSAVSHDLKTPLATIIAAGTTLVAHTAQLEPGAAHELATSIVSEGERLSRLIQNLLSIARLESPAIELRRTPESIEEIVESAVERTGALLDRARVRIELEPDLPLVFVEPLLLAQVVINLLENAARHAGPEAHVQVRAFARDGTVMLQIADDGPGIPESERDKVFEKFYRGRRAGKGDGGVGLGLTICRAVVRAHGGRIGVLERPGGGTLVELALPLSAHANAHDLEIESREVVS
jgi:two-component system sensor histidine kinase KdpD